MGARKKTGLGMGGSGTLCCVSEFLLVFHEFRQRLLVPHRFFITRADAHFENGQFLLKTRADSILLEFGLFNYFFLRYWVDESFGQSFEEMVGEVKRGLPRYGLDSVVSLRHLGMDRFEDLYGLYASDATTSGQRAPIWKVRRCRETPMWLVRNGFGTPRHPGYWKTTIVCEGDKEYLEDLLKAYGFSYGFDSSSGEMFYSNLESVSYGLPPNPKYATGTTIKRAVYSRFGWDVLRSWDVALAFRYSSRRDCFRWLSTEGLPRRDTKKTSRVFPVAGNFLLADPSRADKFKAGL